MILRKMIKWSVKCLSEINCKIPRSLHSLCSFYSPSPSPGAGREIILRKLS